MFCRLLFILFSLPLAVAFSCNLLDPAKEIEAHYDYGQLNKIVREVTCPELGTTGIQIYACFSRVDNGVVQMGCHNHTDEESRALCRDALWSKSSSCNYEKATPMGAFHPRPGNGICCCVGALCNEAPPPWLVQWTPKELETSIWLKDLANFCFMMAIISGFGLLFMAAAVLYTYLEGAYERSKMKEKGAEKPQPTDYEDKYEEKSALEPSSENVSLRFSKVRMEGEAAKTRTEMTKTAARISQTPVASGALRSDIERSPGHLGASDLKLAPTVSESAEHKSAQKLSLTRTAVAKSAKRSRESKSHKKGAPTPQKRSLMKTAKKTTAKKNSKILPVAKSLIKTATPSKSSQSSTQKESFSPEQIEVTQRSNTP